MAFWYVCISFVSQEPKNWVQSIIVWVCVCLLKVYLCVCKHFHSFFFRLLAMSCFFVRVFVRAQSPSDLYALTLFFLCDAIFWDIYRDPSKPSEETKNSQRCEMKKTEAFTFPRIVLTEYLCVCVYPNNIAQQSRHKLNCFCHHKCSNVNMCIVISTYFRLLFVCLFLVHCSRSFQIYYVYFFLLFFIFFFTSNPNSYC